ncbi:MAG: hypothetical protein CL908_00385 [Deltaproteobacteria bacterium]|nr:hypothetical protein [Deltaproteobacteria bacterium]
MTHHAFLVLTDDIDDPTMGQRGEPGDGLIVGRIVECDRFAALLGLLMDPGEEREECGMRGARQHGRQDVFRQVLQARAGGLLDRCLGIICQHEQHGRQLDRLEGERTAGCHPPRLERSVLSRVLVGLGRELELDLASARGVFRQRASSPAIAAPAGEGVVKWPQLGPNTRFGADRTETVRRVHRLGKNAT